ncbi:MAG: FMN-binding negative transcriptional regulator [Cytophagales bacterium]|jgi:transcriptional regulator|nr:FMN-binding negative transcriptional regulator [Cytophagales bacterium]MCA6388976.1 FMN-binding negative transcriptional regulator [Cytophagales bacterium]MCA6390102.1 FMN-binding negative transcriptional regulator [Cytophagales bacterium]MCA6394082.1 FMN-binding negative transcriptional regulator [Cytophagales bacterium]MCA6398821.1 FMN-binding negative transcriptional regulator [Cytophagales bacterium]
MYTPVYARNENEEDLKDFIRKNGFGIVVSTVEGKLWATHIPLILIGDKLQGHISRGNKQWRALPQNEEVMVIFQGPNTYVSSSWYDHENVPSWNYIAVHVYGKAHIQSEEELIESLRQLTKKYEQDSVHPVSVDTMSEKFLHTELRGTIGFEIAIERMEASYKLSQNRDEKNHTQIISELEKRGDHNAVSVANEMRKQGYHN